jgi:hypothetical protein
MFRNVAADGGKAEDRAELVAAAAPPDMRLVLSTAAVITALAIGPPVGGRTGDSGRAGRLLKIYRDIFPPDA